jgi:outer membrane protein assembly factor BamA
MSLRCLEIMRTYARQCFVVITGTVAIIAAVGFYNGIRGQIATRLVEEVAVIGNRRMSKDDVLKHVKTKPGDVYNWDQIQRDFQSVLALGVFDKRETRVTEEMGVRGGVVITFEVVELPRILQVRFVGLRHIKETEILDAFRREQVNLEKDAVDDPVQVQQAIRVIRKFLKPRGWANAEVTVLREMLTSQSVTITFVIRRAVSFQKLGYE